MKKLPKYLKKYVGIILIYQILSIIILSILFFYYFQIYNLFLLTIAFFVIFNILTIKLLIVSTNNLTKKSFKLLNKVKENKIKSKNYLKLACMYLDKIAKLYSLINKIYTRVKFIYFINLILLYPLYGLLLALYIEQLITCYFGYIQPPMLSLRYHVYKAMYSANESYYIFESYGPKAYIIYIITLLFPITLIFIFFKIATYKFIIKFKSISEIHVEIRKEIEMIINKTKYTNMNFKDYN